MRQSSSRYLKGEPGKHRNEYGDRRSNRPFALHLNVVKLPDLRRQRVSDLDLTHITEKYNPFTGKEFLQLSRIRAISNCPSQRLSDVAGRNPPSMINNQVQESDSG